MDSLGQPANDGCDEWHPDAVAGQRKLALQVRGVMCLSSELAGQEPFSHSWFKDGMALRMVHGTPAHLLPDCS
jgi:hypothetical protein